MMPRKYFTEEARIVAHRGYVRKSRSKHPEKHREYQAKSRAENPGHTREINKKARDKRINLLLQWKREKGCKRCGITNPRVLDFHHRNPKDKLFTVSNMRGYALDRLRKEVDKCDVLCANCHRMAEHEKRKNGRIF
jgi:hypothetical protein